MDSEEKKYKCEKCSSESAGEAGECCGEKRKESCPECKNVKSEEGTCSCS